MINLNMIINDHNNITVHIENRTLMFSITFDKKSIYVKIIKIKSINEYT